MHSSLRGRGNSVLCAQCGKWIHGRCAGEEGVTQFCVYSVVSGSTVDVLESKG